MIEKFDVRELIDAIFEKEALIIGGLVAVHEVPDDLIWKLMKSLDQVRTRALVDLAEMGKPSSSERERPNLTPHPAIKQFLADLRGDAYPERCKS